MRRFLTAALAMLLLAACGNENGKNTIEASGNIEATNIMISAKAGGEVVDLRASEGERVGRNDTLLIIDHEAMELQLSRAEAVVEMTEAQLALARKGARSEDIAQAQAQYNKAETQLKVKSDDRERMKKLLDSKSITPKQYQDIEAAYDIAVENFNAADEQLKKLKNITRPEELKQAEARLKEAEANLGIIAKNIKDAKVLSPVDGFVIEKFVNYGEMVSPMSSLFEVSDLSTVKLIIYISETDLGRVKLGQRVSVTTDSYPGKTYPGEVSYISPEAEFTPKNIQTEDERTKLVYKVKVTMPNEMFELKDGMPADAVIQL